MDISILEIVLVAPAGRRQHVGHLFRYGTDQPNGLTRFVPGADYVRDHERATLSLQFLADDEPQTQRLLQDIHAAEFNGYRAAPSRTSPGGPLQLPNWFQNLLPEGAFRAHIAELRGCADDDFFELLAACGTDLPGAVLALPVEDASHALMLELVTERQDALEVSVTQVPMLEGVSISGVQPKLGVNQDGRGRYVARTKLEEATHIIAKLPVVGYARMPEVEHLSMSLARLAGVNACQTQLVPLQSLLAPHQYNLGATDAAEDHFLAVPRYDRDQPGRLHAEDMAQVLGFAPVDKYSRETSYSLVMQVFLTRASLGEEAVLELLRRLAVNELIGNPDCHLKNIGLYYPDGVNPQLPPAYDIVAHHLYIHATGHALLLLPAPEQKALEDAQRQRFRLRFAKTHGRDPGPGEEAPWSRLLLLQPTTLKALAERIGLPYKRLDTVAAQVVKQAAAQWPAAIDASNVTSAQKTRMNEVLERHPAVQALRRRGDT
jgi:serine/threonine-protein kinase HipA